MANRTFVLDSNIWISFVIKKKLSTLVGIIQKHEITVLSCSKLKEEISVVLHRPKFKKYISNKDIIEAIILHDKL